MTRNISASTRVSRGTAAALCLIVLATAVPILLRSGHAANAAIDRCATPVEITTLDQPLPRVAERLRAGGTLTIVALGSSSTAGVGASRPENSYPSRLAVLLEARFPALKIRVVNRGVGGEEAADMERRINRDVLPEHPDLVIWQVGTNGVLRDQDPINVVESVRQGVARIKTSGSDLLLMNPQYAPALLQHEDYHEMLSLLDAAAHAEDVPMFRRFAMMRQWTDDGRMPLALMLSRDRLHMTDLSYDCLARAVSNTIAGAAGAESPIAEAEPVPSS
ncbi:MAG TPA: SGNH/GDSL hydrolase family protein [Stellaceae bacterium]|nr:SGNH/GDSL hydrolase family protein [Stellaceae bacterium]